jgi:hypothetical protein
MAAGPDEIAQGTMLPGELLYCSIRGQFYRQELLKKLE